MRHCINLTFYRSPTYFSNLSLITLPRLVPLIFSMFSDKKWDGVGPDCGVGKEWKSMTPDQSLCNHSLFLQSLNEYTEGYS